MGKWHKNDSSMSKPYDGSLFNLYVAFSRSSGRDTITLLRDFKDNLFRASHDPTLTAEDERLENLDKTTKEWYRRLFPRQVLVVMIESERKKESPVELLSYRYLGKCRLHGSWLRCGQRTLVKQGNHIPFSFPLITSTTIRPNKYIDQAPT